MTTEELLNEFQIAKLDIPMSANSLNALNRGAGCDRDLVKDNKIQGDGQGTNLWAALAYQNLLLLRRIEALEMYIDTNVDFDSGELFPKASG